MESGAAQWIMQKLFSITKFIDGQSIFIVLLVIVILSVTSHLYITSHTTRAVIFIPPLLYFASSLQLNEVAVLFLGIVGMNYCLTFPVSSKALLLFQESDRETFQPQDLLKLSSYLSVIYIFVMVIFYYAYWQWVGLSLKNQEYISFLIFSLKNILGIFLLKESITCYTKMVQIYIIGGFMGERILIVEDEEKLLVSCS